MFATRTETHNGIPFSAFNGVMLSGHKDKRYKDQDHFAHACEHVLGKSWHTRRIVQKFLDCTAIKRTISIEGQPDGIPGAATKDLYDAAYTKEATGRAIRSLVPDADLPEDWTFRLIPMDGGLFFIDTNLNFSELNSKYHRNTVPSQDTITAPYLLTQIIDARADLQIAADQMAELVTSAPTAAIIRVKFDHLLRKRDRNVEQLSLFQTTYLNDARAIRAAINSGERSFNEFLQLLEKADRFKQWLRSRNPDQGLLTEYYQAAVSETWADKLPSKGVRFIIASGLGLAAEALYPSGIGTAAGLGVSAADSLLLDRLLKGWRPSQFVDGPLAQFVDSK